MPEYYLPTEECRCGVDDWFWTGVASYEPEADGRYARVQEARCAACGYTLTVAGGQKKNKHLGSDFDEFMERDQRAIEFEAYAGGDCECFCFAVDDETYMKIKGVPPHPEFDKGVLEHPDLYKLYPGSLFKSGKKLRIRVEVEEIE